MMTTNQMILVTAAGVFAFWPQISAAVKLAMQSLPKVATKVTTQKNVVSYQRAMLALAEVRARLDQTGGVPSDAGKAIEVITHALVEGSSQ